MKKIITCIFLSLPLFSFAQFNRGNVFLGGTLSGSFQNYSAPPGSTSYISQNNSFSIAPSMGFFISEKMAVGGLLGYSNSTQEYKYTSNTDWYKQKNQTLGIGAFSRYYVPISSSIYFSLQGQLVFNRGTLEYTQNTAPDSKSDSYSVGLTFKPIFIFFPSPKWGIEASWGTFGYSYFRNLPDVTHSTTFGFGAGTFGLGLGYYFAKK